MDNNFCSTGLPGLDRILRGILPGDNIVWQFDSLDDYRALVEPFCANARRSGRPLVYIRFSADPPLVEPDPNTEIHTFSLDSGFEPFTSEVHRVIRDAGRGAFHVFDCLSVLAGAWFSDQMLGNFFQLTCPYLFDLETLAFFGLRRNEHSSLALGPIQNTTQLFLDIYNHKNRRYVRPLKVQHRYSSTMQMHHLWQNDSFIPVGDSTVIAELLTAAKWSGLLSDRRSGFWDRAFLEAHAAIEPSARSDGKQPDIDAHKQKLCSMAVTRNPRMRALALQHLSIENLLDIRRRMIGTGLIGGKAVGMLLARAILKNSDPAYDALLEEHDSFFIGSDVFYTYLVRNGIWWVRQQQRDTANFYENATRARRLMITGTFSDETIAQFQEMLDYFGQSPFIVRSSSLLEDDFGNAFAGKYESVFCANQGPRAQRLQDFLAAVRTIYASSMNERALRYRAQRNLLDCDEQMALLVMRVSGRHYARKFYPLLAGVGFSFNPYVWNENIDPEAGVIRLVFGLGTRAVDRSDDDYTRLVALNAPERRPEHNIDEVLQRTQRRVDYIDLEANQLASGEFADLMSETAGLPLDLIADIDPAESRRIRELREHGRNARELRFLTFNRLLTETSFTGDIRRILDTLRKAYNHHVDIEFTVNDTTDNELRINLLQCRPLQVRGTDTAELPVVDVDEASRIIAARSAVIGQSRVVGIDRFIYIVPSKYAALSVRERYDIAATLGRINRAMPAPDQEVTILLGPGRWCTSSPDLGVPVPFADINKVSIVCEIVGMRKELIPDVSLGTHFLSELVELDMLYLAIFPNQPDNALNERFLIDAPNRLLDLDPASERWLDTVRVVHSVDVVPHTAVITLVANALAQKVDCFIQPAMKSRMDVSADQPAGTSGSSGV